MNIAILITLIRIIILPLGLYFFYQDSFLLNILALLLVIIMELSDLFDGIIARKFNAVSDVGKILDPFADHIYRLSFFLFFLLKNFIPLWMFLICFYRDSLVLNLRIFASSSKNKFVAARISGKIKAVVQSFAIISIIFFRIIDLKFKITYLYTISYIVMLICTLVTLWSALDYFIGITKLKVGQK